MPFKSEKQRRFLWAEHPEIAKRWAKEYPESNKGLPMYAKEDKKPDSKEKAAHLDVLGLIAPYVNKRTNLNSTSIHSILDESVKNSEDQLIKVKVPHSDQPTYAGQEREQGEIHGQQPAMADSEGENTHVEKKNPENAINSLLQKISVVLSQSMAQLAENRKAEQEARQPQFQPQNQGIRRYAAPTPVVPPPMGSQPAPAQQPQPQQAPQQQGAGMNSPSANPIQSFGPLSASGNINGNAAFGQKNSPDSLKTAVAGNDFLAKVMGMDYSGLPDPEDLDVDEEYMKSAGKGLLYGALAGATGGLVGNAFRQPGSWNDVGRLVNYATGNDDAAMHPGVFPYRSLDNLGRNMAEGAILGGSAGVGYDALKAMFGAAQPAEEDDAEDNDRTKTSGSSPAWQRSEGKNEEGGLNAKGRASYNKATGGHLKAPVTEKNPTGKAKARRHSFCSRMCGMKRVNTGASTAKDPDSRINKSLRKWNCKCSAAALFGEKVAKWTDDYAHQFNRLYNPENYGVDVRLPDHMNAARQMAMAAAVGGGLGLGRGLIWPGYHEKFDDKGNVITKKRRAPWLGALEGAAIGAGTSALSSYASQTLHQYDPEIDSLMRGLKDKSLQAMGANPAGAST